MSERKEFFVTIQITQTWEGVFEAESLDELAEAVRDEGASCFVEAQDFANAGETYHVEVDGAPA